MKRWPRTRWVLAAYLLLVLAALAVAAVRLSRSTYMPGLRAIELVLLAMPWSLALGIEPMSRLVEIRGMIAIVCVGLVCNGVILRGLAAWLERRRGGRARVDRRSGT